MTNQQSDKGPAKTQISLPIIRVTESDQSSWEVLMGNQGIRLSSNHQSMKTDQTAQDLMCRLIRIFTGLRHVGVKYIYV